MALQVLLYTIPASAIAGTEYQGRCRHQRTDKLRFTARTGEGRRHASKGKNDQLTIPTIPRLQIPAPMQYSCSDTLSSTSGLLGTESQDPESCRPKHQARSSSNSNAAVTTPQHRCKYHVQSSRSSAPLDTGQDAIQAAAHSSHVCHIDPMPSTATAHSRAGCRQDTDQSVML